MSSVPALGGTYWGSVFLRLGWIYDIYIRLVMV